VKFATLRNLITIVGSSHVLSRMFSAAIEHGHTPGIAGTEGLVATRNGDVGSK
jgi:hypothetical protein